MPPKLVFLLVGPLLPADDPVSMGLRGRVRRTLLFQGADDLGRALESEAGPLAVEGVPLGYEAGLERLATGMGWQAVTVSSPLAAAN